MTQKRPRIDRRLADVPPQIRDRVAAVLSTHGLAGASRETGISREAILQVVARGRCMRGTLALLREWLRNETEAA